MPVPFQVWELYKFTIGPQVYRYTSNATDKTVDGNLYTPMALKRTSIAASAEEERNSITITAPADFPIGTSFVSGAPSVEAFVEVHRFNEADSAIAELVWSGRIFNFLWNKEDQLELQCEPSISVINRVGLRRVFQLGCPHVLYGAGCNLNKTSFDHATTVASVSGTTLVVASVNGAFNYSGGYIDWVNGVGITERRFIEKADTVTLTLMHPFAGIASPNPVTIYAGCDHTLFTCDGVFNNAVNYGGFPFFPERNPFEEGVF